MSGHWAFHWVAFVEEPCDFSSRVVRPDLVVEERWGEYFSRNGVVDIVVLDVFAIWTGEGNITLHGREAG